MNYTIIGTWRMSLEGIQAGAQLLAQGGTAADAVELAIKITEDEPFYKSVGFGGLPNEHGEVELDAAFMDGDTLSIGALVGVQDIANPIVLARRLSQERFNSFLAARGAENFAQKENIERKNMLTDRAKRTWEKRVKEISDKNISPYDGHDTVGIIARDNYGSMVAGVSTSGLFMKKSGRVGDSALPGCGFYADSDFGAAAATGLGEDLMKKPLCYEIVRSLELGYSLQEIMDKILFNFEARLKQKYSKAGAMSLIGIDAYGNWNIATNCEFSFAAANQNLPATVFLANKKDLHTVYEAATPDWLNAYLERIHKPID